MKIPYLSQNNYPNYRFPVNKGSEMKVTGCGIVSTTMVLRYLTGEDIRVEDVATWADNNGHFNGKGVNGTIFAAAAKKWNVGNVKVVTDINTVKAALMNGRPVISYQKTGTFAAVRHFIVLKGIDDNGKYHVNDPSHSEYCNRAFTESEINKNHISYYIFDAKK